ncbi:MAG: zinc ribbon domain-containing protein [Polyangiaceae bacterium]|nr:zinc ribbon domain-containing protein [Polyangiaceae bacterium]MCW5791227.1 zinc ribbon domain-containing protein [Polyangiaceae bacterium]
MTYEYLCEACGHQWEADQSISAAPLKDCPSCGQAHAKRQISGGAGFILKGGGWYADLYGSSNGGASTKANGADKPSAESKPSADKPSADKPSAESKPAKPAKAEAKP